MEKFGIVAEINLINPFNTLSEISKGAKIRNQTLSKLKIELLKNLALAKL